MTGGLHSFCSARKILADHQGNQKLVVGLQSATSSPVQAHCSFTLVNHEDERKNLVRGIEA